MATRDAHHDPDPDWPLVEAVQRGIPEREAEQDPEAEQKTAPPPLNPEAEDAFRRLVERYERRVLRFFIAKGYGPEDARELTQQSFLRVFEGMERLESSFSGFLYTTARNVYRNDVRRRHAQSRTGTEISADDVEGADQRYLASDDDVLARLVEEDEQDHMRQMLRTAIDALPARRRQCLDLRLQGLEEREIADTLGISKGSVKTHLFKARQDLKSKLGGSEPDRLTQEET